MQNILGRIVSRNRSIYRVMMDENEVEGRLSGKLQYKLENKEEYPVVGDLVCCKIISTQEAIIEDILPRKTMISRKVAGGRSDLQVLAANIDKVFITMALNNDFNMRRLERYLAVAWDSGAIPIVLLTKADLCEDTEEKLEAVRQTAIGVPVMVVSVVSEVGMTALRDSIKLNETVVFIGSSGVGKSSLVNGLLGETVQMINTIDEHDKGRHTTTTRQLFVLPSGGIIIDTPGMRELQFNQGDIQSTFEDIEVLSKQCYFSNCQHEKEPKCAIKAAIERGDLCEKRYDSYLKLKRQLKGLEARRKQKERKISSKYNH